MRTTTTYRIAGLTLGLILGCTMAFAQGDKASRPSPPATASGKVGPATITIEYSSPAVKGRKIWGELVPYGKVWRAGANEATVFKTDREITVEGKPLPAGEYSLFATPGENEWTIIFNSQTGQWGIKRGGDANRDPANDVLAVAVKPKKSATMNERLTYTVNNNGFSLNWENLEVPVAIK
ncbi:MAG: DUF2911 domain-containing protein [Cyclobacteriaceae bacterium]|nr:DUF2911 domain-containing protein [Cyclobacteriaceae bacterium]